MSLVEASLGHSYDQRAIQHQAALELERIGRQLRGERNQLIERLYDADIDFAIFSRNIVSPLKSFPSSTISPSTI